MAIMFDVVIISSFQRTIKQSAAFFALFNSFTSLISQDTTIEKITEIQTQLLMFEWVFFLLIFISNSYKNKKKNLRRMIYFSWLTFSEGNSSASFLSNLLNRTRDPPLVWNFPTFHVWYNHVLKSHKLPIRLVLFNEQ